MLLIELSPSVNHVSLNLCLFGFFLALETLSFIWRRQYYRWRATNFDLCSALMAIELWWFFSVPHLLWHGCGDIYGRPYTHCRRRQFMPVLAAHIIALNHVLSPATIRDNIDHFFSGQRGDNACSKFWHKLSPATEYAVNTETNCRPKFGNSN